MTTANRSRSSPLLCKLLSAAVFTLLAGTTTSIAQILQYKEPTEMLVKQYERLRADGALLSPEGWERASRLFKRPKPYPADSEIFLISVPGIIGRWTADGDRARVGTKWGDSCGTVDSQMRYKPIMPNVACIMTEESFSLVFVHHPRAKMNGVQEGDIGEWRIEEAPDARAADIPAVIKYVEKVREESKDPVIRSNADKTIAALKGLTHGCGTASAC
jgi:hypothetical protein